MPEDFEPLLAQAREANRLRAVVESDRKAYEGRLHDHVEIVRTHREWHEESDAKVAQLRAALAEALRIAEAGFVTDYGFNYEASIAPRARIAALRKLLDGAG